MKRRFPFILLAGIGIMFFIVNSAYALRVSFDVSSTSGSDDVIDFGETFDVTLWAEEVASLGSLTIFGFDVMSDLSLDSYLVNSAFADLGSGNYIAGAYLGIDNAGQNIALARLSFTADHAGGNSIDIEGLYDGISYGMYYEAAGIDISGAETIFVENAPVPEPATLLLLSLGIPAFGIINRKRKPI